MNPEGARSAKFERKKLGESIEPVDPISAEEAQNLRGALKLKVDQIENLRERPPENPTGSG